VRARAHAKYTFFLQILYSNLPRTCASRRDGCRARGPCSTRCHSCARIASSCWWRCGKTARRCGTPRRGRAPTAALCSPRSRNAPGRSSTPSPACARRCPRGAGLRRAVASHGGRRHVRGIARGASERARPLKDKCRVARSTKTKGAFGPQCSDGDHRLEGYTIQVRQAERYAHSRPCAGLRLRRHRRGGARCGRARRGTQRRRWRCRRPRLRP
jgi:hypothetical protein